MLSTPTNSDIYILEYTVFDVYTYFQVDAKAAGKAAIHCACAQGNVDVVKCLLEFSPDLEIKVYMYTFVHFLPFVIYPTLNMCIDFDHINQFAFFDVVHFYCILL